MKPVAPLTPLALGQSDLYTNRAEVSIGNNNYFSHVLDNDDLANPVSQLIGQFDVSFVLVWLVPLVIIAFSYNVVSAERE